MTCPLRLLCTDLSLCPRGWFKALRRSGDITRGVQQLYEAVRCEPRSPGANGNLASALQSLGKEEEAFRFRKLQLRWPLYAKYRGSIRPYLIRYSSPIYDSLPSSHSRKPPTRHLALIDAGISAFALQAPIQRHFNAD
jgi:hypothetical protein